MKESPDTGTGTLPGAIPAELMGATGDFARFMLAHKFAIDEVMTKVKILKEEFSYIHEYSPIEQVSSRLKTPTAIVAKAARIGCRLDYDEIRAQMSDVAGVRVTCSFISDVYWVRDMLAQQADLDVLVVKDYVGRPKANGYRSLHLIVEVPVFLSDRRENVRVEIQIRTVAMDFWASLEHKIYYKYEEAVPVRLLDELSEAADAAHQLDKTMERLHVEVARQHHVTDGSVPGPGSRARPSPTAAPHSLDVTELVVQAVTTIDADSARVWQLLSDGARWSTWNQVLGLAEGRLLEQEIVRLVASGGDTVRDFYALVLLSEPGLLAWETGDPDHFCAHRTLRVTSTPTGTVLTHRDAWRGPLAAEVFHRTRSDLAHQLNEFNAALKAAAEA